MTDSSRPLRVGLRELVVLFLLSAVLDIGNDWVRYGPGAYFSLYGAGSELFAAALLLGMSLRLGLSVVGPGSPVANTETWRRRGRSVDRRHR